MGDFLEVFKKALEEGSTGSLENSSASGYSVSEKDKLPANATKQFQGSFLDVFALSLKEEQARKLQAETAANAQKNLAGRSEFTRGLLRGVDTLQATYEGGLGMYNAAIGDQVAADKRFANYREQMRQASENPATVTDFFSTDEKKGAFASPGNFATYAAGTLGQAVPSLTEAVISGIAGAAVGAAIVPAPDPADVVTVPAGAIGGFLGRNAMRRAIASAAQQYASRGMAQDVAEQTAERYVRQAVANRIASNVGSGLAVSQTTALHEGGGMWAEGMEKGYNSPYSAIGLGQVSGFSEALFGAAPAAVRAVLGKAAVNETAKELGWKQAAGYAWDVVKNSGEEGVQEAFQEYLGAINQSINDPKFKLYTKENFMQWAEAAAAGAITGGVVGGGSVSLQAIRDRKRQLEEIQSKGFVSESDAQQAGIEGASRRERMANLEAERQDLDRQEQELVAQSDQEFIQQQQAGQAPTMPSDGVPAGQVDEAGGLIPQVSQEDLDREFAARMAAQGGNVAAPIDEETPASFAARMARGEPITSLEDQQYRMNNAAAIEEELQKILASGATSTASPQPTTPAVNPFADPFDEQQQSPQQPAVVPPAAQQPAPALTPEQQVESDRQFAEQKAAEQVESPEVPVVSSPEQHAELPMYGVYETTFRGKKQYAVKSFDKGGFGDSLFDSLEEARKNSELEIRRANDIASALESAEAAEKDEAKKKADYEASFKGFLSTDPKTKGRQLKVLGSSRQYNGKVVTVKDLIEQKIAGGAVVNASGQLESPDGAYLGSDKITKIGIDYARHLLASRTEAGREPEQLQPPGVERIEDWKQAVEESIDSDPMRASSIMRRVAARTSDDDDAYYILSMLRDEYADRVSVAWDLVNNRKLGEEVRRDAAEWYRVYGDGADANAVIDKDLKSKRSEAQTEGESDQQPEIKIPSELKIGQGARPIPGMESDEANYTVLKRKPDVIPDTFKVVISGRPFGKGWLSVDGTGMTGEEAYRRAFDNYMRKRPGELRDKTRRESIRKAIDEQGGFENNSADDVEAIRRKLYDGADTPTGTEIRAVMDEMKVEAGRKLAEEKPSEQPEIKPTAAVTAATDPQAELENDQLPPSAIGYMVQGDRLKGEMWRSPTIGGQSSKYGAFYAANEEGAGKYSRGVGVNAVVAQMVELNDPLVVDTKQQAMEELGIDEDSLQDPSETQDIHHYIDIAIFEEATRKGYDGVVYKQEGYDGNPFEVHVFNPPDIGELPSFTVQGKKQNLQPNEKQSEPPAPSKLLDELESIEELRAVLENWSSDDKRPKNSYSLKELIDLAKSRLQDFKLESGNELAEDLAGQNGEDAKKYAISQKNQIKAWIKKADSEEALQATKASDSKPKPPTGYKPLEEFTPVVTQTLSPDLELEENRNGIKELALKQGEAVGYRVYPKRGSIKGGYWQYGTVRYEPSGSHASIELADGTVESVGGSRLVRLEPVTATPPAEQPSTAKPSEAEQDLTEGQKVALSALDAMLASEKPKEPPKPRSVRKEPEKTKQGQYVLPIMPGMAAEIDRQDFVRRYRDRALEPLWGWSNREEDAEGIQMTIDTLAPIYSEIFNDIYAGKRETIDDVYDSEPYERILNLDNDAIAVSDALIMNRLDEQINAALQDYPKKAAKKPTRKSKQTLEEAKSDMQAAHDAAAALMEKIRGKLMSGIDPEISAEVVRVAYLYAKAGVKTFKGYVKVIVENFGDAFAREFAPYMQDGWTALNIRGLVSDPTGKVEDYLAKEAKEDYGTPEKPNRIALGRHFYEKLKGGASYPRITDARKEASELLGGSPKDGSSAIKDIDESVEIGVVLAARDIAQSGLSDEDIYDQLVDLYGRQPNLANRTSTSMKEQAYSTPAPLAFIANRRAGVTAKDTVYDSSAGNGMLLIVGGKRYANELNEDRAESLRSQGVDTHQGDATSYSIDKPIDALVINPPFGTVEDANGKSISWNIEGVRTDKIDHAISMRSLADIPENGKAVIVIAAKGFEKSEPKSDSARGTAYLAEKRFYDHVYDNYNVTDHFTVHGDLYRKQGASFPVDVIVISGKGKSQRPKPYNIVGKGIPEVIRTWEELKDAKLRPVSSVSSTSVTGGEGIDSGSVVAWDATATTKDAERVPAGAPGKRMGAKDGGKPKSQKLGVADGQPRAPDKVDGKNAVGGLAPKTERTGAGGGLGDAGRPSGSARRDSLKPDESAETDFQVSYSPGSKNKSVDTLIPRNHQAAVEKSLDAISEVYGDIDEFVAKELGYEMDEFENVFSAEQVDALAMAIARHKDGGAFIIGDQTGVGKGRAAAAMMVYANRNGMVPVFITEKPTLYADMIRDLIDIGRSTEDAPFNLLMTNALSGKDAIPLPDGRVLRQSQDAAKSNLSEAVASVLNGDTLSVEGKPIGRGKKKTAGERVVYNAVFTTYSQLQPVKQMAPERARLLKSISSQSFFILDESHNAGGGSDSDPNANQERRSSGQQATITRAEIVRDLISEAAGLYFSSATYAKRPQTMGLYAKTGMTAATNGDPNALSEAIATGGVPLQQVVSEQLVESGMYLRRERSFDGVEFNPKTVDVDLKNLDNIASIFSAINFFDGFAQEAIESIADEITSTGGTIAETEATGQAGLESTSFSSILHNLVDQMLLAVKADAVANEAIDSIKNGESPVIYVDSTLEAALKRQVEETGASQGEEIDFSYKDLVRRYLERSREYTTRTNADDPDSVVRIRLTDQQLGEAGVLAYERAMEMIESFSGDMPASPIDWIRKRITDAGYSIGEITGRQVILEYQDDGTVKLGRRSEEEEGSGGRTTTVSRFNSGDLDAVLINPSGSTGISMHASEKFKNQKPRHMIIGQPARNIDTFMQSLGRVHRTGQIVLPRFTLLMTNAPAEIRPASVLMKKLSSLNANVTASAKGSVSFDAPDVINIVGDQVVAEYLADNLELDRNLGELVQLRRDGTPKRNPGIAKKASGRMALRPVSEQKDFWDSVIATYDELISELNRVGKNPLLASTLDLSAKTIESVTIFDGDEGSANLFMHPASIETIVANKPGKPMTSEEVQGAVKEFYGEPATGAVVSKWLEDIEREIRTAAEEYLNDGVGRGLSGEELQVARTRFQVVGGKQFDSLMRRLRSFAPGKSVSVYERSSDGTMLEVIPGFVTKVKRIKGGNPLAASKWMVDIAVASPDRIAKTALSRTGQQEIEAGSTGGTYKEFIPNNELLGESRLREFDDSDASTTEIRHVGVGNILAAYAQLGPSGGQVTFFTDTEGKIRRGVLMPRSFRLDRWEEARPVVLDNIDQAHEFLSSGGQLTTPDRVLSLMLVRGELIARAPKAKSKSGKYTINPGILDAASPQEFGSIGNRMEMAIAGEEKQKQVLSAIMQVASLQAVGQDKPLARNIKAAAQSKSQSDLDKGLRNPPDVLYQTEPDIDATIRSKALDLGIAANKQGITQFEDFIAYSVDKIGEAQTRRLGNYLTMVGKTVGMQGVRPAKDVLGVPMTQEQYTQLAKETFTSVPAEQVEAGIEAAMLTGLPQTAVGFSPSGTPVPRRGLMQANVKTDTPAFKKWFGDSKVVDKDGNPLVVYHGTTNTFEKFFQKEGTKSPSRLIGFFFSPSAEMASQHVAKRSSGEPGSQVYPVYLSVKNPYVESVMDHMDMNVWTASKIKKWKQSLIDKGYDGVYIKPSKSMPGYEDGVWIAFESNQIKSAIANVGTFDPNNPNMLMQEENKTRITSWRDGYKLERKVGNGKITFWADLQDFYDDGNYSIGWDMEADDDTPRGTGSATAMLLELLDLAKRKRFRGKPVSYRSDSILSQASVNLHLRLMEAGAPFVPENGMMYTLSAEALASLDIDAIRSQLAINYASRSGDSDTNVLKQEENPRIGMSYKDANKRVAALTEAAKMLKDGSITKDQYAEIVDRNKTVTPYDFDPEQGLMQGDFDQPADYEFTESDYRPAVVAYARDKWGSEVAANGKPTWQNFVRWFDDSAVVDKDGKPLVVYHGTRSYGFTKFARSLHDETSLLGVSFSRFRSVAKRYSDDKDLSRRYARGETEYNPGLLEVYVKSRRFPSIEDLISEIENYYRKDYLEISQIEIDEYAGNNGINAVNTESIGEKGEVVVLTPDGNIKSSTGNVGTFDPNNPNMLMQQQAQGGNVKGWTKFISGTRALIGATNKADVSTVIHEFAHPIRRFLLDRKIPQDQRADITDEEIEMLEKKCGAGSVIDGKWVTKWDVPAEEKFARMWEQYWFEGKSPNSLLNSLFEKISRWMRGVYQSIQQITGGPLAPEVRELFDKLVQRGLSPEQRSAPIGAEQETSPPVPMAHEDELTSNANAVAEATRAILGIKGYADPARESFQQWIDEAKSLLRQDPTLGERLRAELSNKARSLTKVEEAVLSIHLRHIKNLIDRTSDRLFAAKDANDSVAAAQALRETDMLVNQFEELTDAINRAGSETARALVARKIALRADFTQGNLLRMARIANAGKSLSEEQTEEVITLSRRIAELEGDLAKKTQEIDDLERKIAVQRSIDEVKKEVGGKPSRSTLRKKAAEKATRLVKKLSGIFARNTATDTLQQTEDEQLAEEARDVIKAYVDAGVYSFGEFMSKFKKDIGMDVPVSARAAFSTAWTEMREQGDIPTPQLTEPDTREVRRIARMLQQSLVEDGITEPDEVIEGVYESLQEILPEITRRESMDAMSGYGQYSKLSQDPNDVIIRDLNGQYQQMAKLDDMRQGMAPKKTGGERRTPSDKEREFIQQVNQMKRNSKYFITDPESQLKSIFQSIRTALRNRIYDLDRAINVTGTPIPGRSEVVFSGNEAKEIADLRKQRDELMAEYKRTFPKPGATFEQRAAAAERAADRAIAEIEKEIASGKMIVKGRPEPISTPALNAKLARLDALKAAREAAFESQIKEREEQRAEKAYIANLLARIADYEDRKRQGYFEPRGKKERRKLSPQEVELSRQLVDLKDEFFRLSAEYRLANMGRVEKAWDNTKETMHLSRAIMTSFDLSAVFRQGGIASLAHPRLSLESAREMRAAIFSQSAEFKSIDDIEKDSLYTFAMQCGLPITTNKGKIERQEEAYMGRLVRYGIGKKGTKLNKFTLWALKPISASARAYTVYLNSMRFKLFKYLVSNLGVDGSVTLDEGKVIAAYVGVATGRAELGKFNQVAANLNTVFFAPRYVASRFQYLAMPFYLLPSTKVSGRVKKMIAMEYARHAMGLAAFLGLSVALGSLLTDDEEEKPTVEFDPRSSDFMKLRIGETRIDPMAGLSQTVTLIGQLSTGQKKQIDGDVQDLYGKNRKFGDPDLWDVTTGFIRKKLAPIPGAIVDLRVGENVIGEKETPLTVVTDLFIPLSAQEVGETMKARGLVGGLGISGLSLLGMGGGTYGPRTAYATADKAKRLELLNKDLDNVKWDSKDPVYSDFLTVDELEKFKKKREQRKQSLVYAASADPKRKEHASEESFKQSVAERDKAFDAVIKAGMGYEEIKQLLVAYYKRNYGSAYEIRGGNYRMKESLTNRLRAIKRKMNEKQPAKA